MSRAPLRPARPRPLQARPRLPENESPAAVSKSPVKVTRQVPSRLMVPSAPLAAPRRRWVGARAEGGQELCLQGGEKRVNSQNQNQTLRVPTVAEVPTPAALGAWGRGARVPLPCRRPRSKLARLRKGAEGAPAEPKSALRAGGCAGLVLLPGLGTRASGAAVPGAGAGAEAARVPPAASARAAEPAPGRRRADGRARAGCARGSCSPTDWRGPAGRLKGAPTSRPPGRRGPLEGVSARPRRAALGARRPRRLRGSRAGGGRGDGVTAPGAAAGRCHSLPPARSLPGPGFAAGFREGDRSAAAPGPEVCPGSRAAGSWRAGQEKRRLRSRRRTAGSAGRAGGAGSRRDGASRLLRAGRAGRSGALRRVAGSPRLEVGRRPGGERRPRAPRPSSGRAGHTRPGARHPPSGTHRPASCCPRRPGVGGWGTPSEPPAVGGRRWSHRNEGSDLRNL